MKYNEDELLDLLETLGIDVVTQTHSHYLCLCPFHENNNDPAFEISKINGLWLCFNQACGAKGNLAQLVHRLSGEKSGGVARVMDLMNQERAMALDPEEELRIILGEKVIKNDWSEEKLEGLSVNYDDGVELSEKLGYLLDRGFTKETMRAFEIGYSSAKDRIVVPVRNENFRLVGVIGRAASNDVQPRYLYSDNMPKKGLLFNLCHAKNYNSVILVEGSLDCMKVFQAGFPNVCAILGSAFSDQQADLVNRYFLDVIIFSDNDDAGKALHAQVQDRCPRKNLYFVTYPEGIKDPGEMSEEQIRTAIETKKTELDLMFEGLHTK